MSNVADADGLKPRYVSLLMRLALLSPDIVEAIAAGHQPVEMTTDVLTYPADLPIEWTAQKAHLGFV